MVDIDDTIIEVHGYAKQGSSYGHSGVRGLNALLATASTSESAPAPISTSSKYRVSLPRGVSDATSLSDEATYSPPPEQAIPSPATLTEPDLGLGPRGGPVRLRL